MKLIDYIQGNRRGPEANKLERDAMNDPFMQEALDGFDAVEGDHLSAITELESKFEQKLPKRKQAVNYRLWAISVAASVVLVLGIGGLLFFEIKQPENTAFRVPKAVSLPPKNTEETPIQAAEKPTKTIAQHIKKLQPAKAPENKVSPIVTKEMTESAFAADVKETQEVASAPIQHNAEIKVDEAPKVMNIKPESVDNALQGKMAGITIRVRGASSINQSDIADVQYPATLKKGKITGKVIDMKAEPIIGATVKVKGTNTGVITDINGQFEIPATVGKDKLEANYIGFDKQEISARGDSNIIRMKESQLALNEVVVVGYGIQKKSMITGSISRISSDKNFGENEFKKYFENQRDKEICNNVKGFIRVEFHIDGHGKPENLKVLKCNCPDLQDEFKTLLEKSPHWTKTNRTVRLTINFK